MVDCKMLSKEMILPQTLNKARKAAEDRIKVEKEYVWFIPQITECKFDINECVNDEHCRRIVECIDPQATGIIDLFGESHAPINWEDKVGVYKHFEANEESLSKSLNL